MERMEWTFTSADRTNRIHCWIWLPDGEPAGILQIATGMAETALRYEPFARHLNSLGITAVASDHLGQGLSVKDEADWGWMGPGQADEQLVQDLRTVTDEIRRRWPGKPVWLLGHSLGSFIVRRYVAENDRLAGAILMGTAHVPAGVARTGLLLTRLSGINRDDRRRSKLLNYMTAGAYNRPYKPARTEFDWLTTDEEIVDAYIADPACGYAFTLNGHDAMFRTLLWIADTGRLADVRGGFPVLIVSGAEDPVGDMGRGPARVADEWKEHSKADVSLKLYPGMRHEILNEIGRQGVWQDLSDWLMSGIIGT